MRIEFCCQALSDKLTRDYEGFSIEFDPSRLESFIVENFGLSQTEHYKCPFCGEPIQMEVKVEG